MTTCYSFASPFDHSHQVDRAEIMKIARRVSKSFGGQFKTPPLCAFLEHGGVLPEHAGKSQFAYLLRFEYRSLRSVSDVVLTNRQEFRHCLGRTLTMLEYPDDEKKRLMVLRRNPGIARQRWSPRLDEIDWKRGILLIKEHIANKQSGQKAKGFGSWAALSEIAQECLAGRGSDILLRCTDVFGPYDYVVEFEVQGPDDLDDKMRKLLKPGPFIDCVASMQWWFCDPFAPLSS